MANTPFIDRNNARDAYEESKKWMRQYFEPIDEFDRIARNRPSANIPPELPKVTDGTVASIIQETPKRILQQEPTGLVECAQYPEYAKIADIVWREKLIPMSSLNGSYLLKCWNMLGKAMTHGISYSYTFYTSRNSEMYTDFVIPYVKDVLPEKGKVYFPDCNVASMRSWYQKRDIKAIINREKKLSEQNKKYKSEWNLELLAELLESGGTVKPAEYQTPAEREKGGESAEAIEIIHVFQKGVGAEFYSFSPNFENGKVLRVKTNPDPRGMLPLDPLYCNIDLSNPLGRGTVELSGGVQNLMDQKLQMNQFLGTMLMGPPIKKWGQVNKATLKFMPNAIWEMGQNRNTGDVEPYEVNNVALTNFIPDMQFLQSKVYNLNNSQDTSIGASVGDANQSKTQAGVQAQQQRLGVSDNYLRKQAETWSSAQAETALNIHFAEMTGKQEMALKSEDIKEFAKTPAAQFIKGNTLTIPYRDIQKVTFHFEVNPDSSEVKEDSENVEKLIQTMELASKMPNPEIQQKMPGIFKVLVKEIGAEGIDELFPEDQTDQNGQPVNQQQQQPAVTPEMVQQMIQEGIGQAMEAIKSEANPQDSPEEKLIKSLGIKYDKLPAEARRKVLADLGLESDEPDPIEKDEDLKAFTALGTAEGQIESAQNTRQNTRQQAEQAEMQANANTEEAPEPNAEDDMNRPLDQGEIQIATELMNRGFDENDVEQAIVMLRSGRTPEEIMQILGAKVA